MMPERPADPVLRHIRKLAAEPADALPDAELLARFTAARDEAAFAALVRRHGPMVHAVCRRVLHNPHDAEDAFQATFVVLAQKAAAIRKREALASWLHGVALRLARKARAARKSLPEGPGAEPASPDPSASAAVAELHAGLDEELGRLPDKYRAPLVLCYLEGHTQDEAARVLGWSKGTLRRRLDEGRELLRARLVRRGLTLGAGLVVAAVAEGTAPAAVSPLLVQAVVRAAVHLALGGAAGSVLALAEAGAPAPVSRLKTAILLAVAVGLLGVGGYLLYRLPAGDPPPPLEVAAAPPPPQAGPPVDAFGDPLPPGALARLGTVRFRAGMPLCALAFAPDGKTYAAAGRKDAGLVLWDAVTGKELRRITEGLAPADASCLAFSPVGNVLAVGYPAAAPGQPHTIHLWDLATGHHLADFGGDAVAALAFAPDGRTLAAGGHADAPALPKVWDVGRGEEVAAFAGEGRARLRGAALPPGAHLAVAFAPDGHLIASAATGSGEVALWDAATGREVRRLPDPAKPGPPLPPLHGAGTRGHGAPAFSADGRLLAVPRYDGNTDVWEVADGRHRFRVTAQDDGWPGLQKVVSSVAFADDGRTLVTATVGGRLRRWDASSGRPRGTETVLPSTGRTEPVLSPGGQAVTLLGIDRDRYEEPVWDVATGEQRAAASPQGAIHALALDAGGQRIATWEPGAVRLWDARDGRLLRSFARPNEGVNEWSLTLSPDGSRVVACGKNPVAAYPLTAWDTATGEPPPAFAPAPPNAHAAAFAPDGQVLACAGPGPVVRLLDAATGRERRAFREPRGTAHGVTFSTDGARLAAAFERVSQDGRDVTEELVVWDVVTGGEVRRWTFPGRLSGRVGLGPGGRLLFGLSGSGQDGLVHFWEVDTSRELPPVPQRRNDREAVALSPDGRLLVAGGRLWDLPSRRVVHEFAGQRPPILGWDALSVQEMGVGDERAGHRWPILSAAFAPDGRTLVTGSQDATALVWDVAALLRQPPP